MQGNRPCHHGLLRLLAGPHRFEAGWWAAGEGGADDPTHTGTGLALRDYFVAHNAVVGLVWVFRERLAPLPDGAQGRARPPAGFCMVCFETPPVLLPPLSQCCALRAGGRRQRGGAALARRPPPGARQFQARWVASSAVGKEWR